MQAHNDAVLTVEFDNHKILSGAYDGIIIQWELQTGKFVNAFNSHDGSVSDKTYAETRFFSGLYNSQLNEMLYTSSPAVLSIQFMDNKLVTGSSDGILRIWNFDNQPQ